MTANEHPFLQNEPFIPWSALTPERVEPDIRLALSNAEAELTAIRRLVAAPAATLTYANTLMALEKATEPLGEAWGKVSHLDSVCNSPELRKAYKTMLPEVTDFFSSISLDSSLWEVIRRFSESPQAAGLDPVRRRHLEETVADFRDAGADLPEAEKSAMRILRKELAELTQTYSENVLDATNDWEYVTEDPAMLSGLPPHAVAAARQSAREKGYGSDESPAWRFTLQAPSMLPVLTYADNDALRECVWRAYNTLCFEGSHSNSAIAAEILCKRDAFAKLLGKPDYAACKTARRMVGSGENAMRFIENLRAKVAQAFVAEVRDLQTFKAGETKTPIEALQPWETTYWAERQRKAFYDFDEEALRPYFPIDAVINGLFELAEKVFQLTIVEIPAVCHDGNAAINAITADDAVEVWHPSVRFYTLHDERNHHLGSFYADWHPRESKRDGAWMNYFVTGGPSADGNRRPHLGLICGNLTAAVDGKPALLTHREVETVFHEFGHLLHHLCGEVEVPSLNGIHVAWDFVELPSQIMENWCWEKASLDLFARHWETGATIPEALLERMRTARKHLAASATMRQLSFGRMDFGLHCEWVKTPDQSLLDFCQELLEDYQAELKTQPLPNLYHFTHIFSGGYACGYYSYKWAEVLDADAFTRFLREGILNPATGKAFREAILARGNSEPADVLFRNFMGRDPDPDALLRRVGLLTTDD
jgi:oligopeptidase A